jgi:hypothetical protein
MSSRRQGLWFLPLHASLVLWAFWMVLELLPAQEQSEEHRVSARLPKRDTGAIDRQLEKEAAPYVPLVEQFYAYDVGALRDPSQIFIVRGAWQRLRSEKAIPAVVQGLNKAIRGGASCPVVAFASKLRELLRQTSDAELAAYVLRNLSREPRPYQSHVEAVRREAHAQLLRLRSREYERLQLLRQMGAVPPDPSVGRSPGQKTTSEQASKSLVDEQPATPVGDSLTGDEPLSSLGQQPSSDERPREGLEAIPTAELKDLLRELERRASEGVDEDVMRQKASVLLAIVTEGRSKEGRLVAIRVLGRLKERRAVPPLIEVLRSDDVPLRNAAATALTRITGRLYGPAPGATQEEVRRSIEFWQQWWKENQGGSSASRR